MMCEISDYSTGFCRICAEMARMERRMVQYIQGRAHVCRAVVSDRYGLRSEPTLYCADHCPSCRAARVKVA